MTNSLWIKTFGKAAEHSSTVADVRFLHQPMTIRLTSDNMVDIQRDAQLTTRLAVLLDSPAPGRIPQRRACAPQQHGTPAA